MPAFAGCEVPGAPPARGVCKHGSANGWAWPLSTL